MSDDRFRKWVTEYATSILRTCFVYLGDAALAEDAMQETFFRAWRQMDSFRGERAQSEKSWLMRIAINICHDYQRSKWNRNVDTGRSLDELSMGDSSEPMENRLAVLDIAALPEKLKQVILLYYYHDMTVREIAKTLGVSPSIVSVRLKKARGILERMWKEDAP